MTENKVCFITGSASNNGRRMAERLAELGYDIAIHHSGRSPENAEEVKRNVEAFGRKAEIFEEDLSVPGAAERLFRKFREKYDRLDLFINNAGVTVSGNLPDITEADYERVTGIDYRAAVFCVREACEFMREKKIPGSVLVISSNHHDRLWRYSALYGSTKEALCRFVKYAAVEYIRDGIRVNCIAPGWIDWEIVSRLHMAEIAEREIPAKRFVTSGEIADWAHFLAGPAARSLTGQTIDLDGGASLLNGPMEEYGL